MTLSPATSNNHRADERRRNVIIFIVSLVLAVIAGVSYIISGPSTAVNLVAGAATLIGVGLIGSLIAQWLDPNN